MVSKFRDLTERWRIAAGELGCLLRKLYCTLYTSTNATPVIPFPATIAV